MTFTGPRPACKALDGIMDEIGDPIVALIKTLGLDPAVEGDVVCKIEDYISQPFIPGSSTGSKLRDYIYELNRELIREVNA